MKMIISGGRNYKFTSEDKMLLVGALVVYEVTEIVQGGASGADACAKEFAEEQGIKCTEFKADWDKFGRSAGPIRNAEMADYADILFAFPGGKGTANMVAHAKDKEYNLIIASEERKYE